MIDPDLVRVPATQLPPARTTVRAGGLREPFLKGPVPLVWLAAAGKLGGKAMQVGVALWYRAGLERTRRPALPRATLTAFGVTRFAKARALAALEAAGLVLVERRAGRSARITILDLPPHSVTPRDPTDA